MLLLRLSNKYSDYVNFGDWYSNTSDNEVRACDANDMIQSLALRARTTYSLTSEISFPAPFLTLTSLQCLTGDRLQRFGVLGSQLVHSIRHVLTQTCLTMLKFLEASLRCKSLYLCWCSSLHHNRVYIRALIFE